MRASRASIARHCEAIVELQRRGAVAFDYGNNLRGEAKEAGYADAFAYPGFVPDAYSDYSAPWFGTHHVLRGGCWVTRARLLRNTWRNFYTPDRRDVWAGFRTCARRPE